MIRSWQMEIGGQPWTVEFLPPSRMPREPDGEVCEGITYQDRRLIRIANNLPPETETDALVHEIIHARLWDLDHAAVYELARLISSAFWRSVDAAE